MAIGHLHAGLVQRAMGGSSVDAAAYASRSRLTDERTGQVYDYSRDQDDVVAAFIVLPKNAPVRFRDRATLWNEMERRDNRKNSRTARKIELALPHELTAQQREWLLRDYVRENFTRKGLACDAAIHRPHAHGDQRNDHAHLIIPTRFIDISGFSKKDRASNDKETLREWRDAWEKLANHHLERHGHEARISMKTLEAQGVERTAQIHIGAAAAALERKGIQTDRGDQHRAISNDNRQQAQERQPGALEAYIIERRRQFLEQQHVAWNAMEQAGRDMLGQHSQARTGLQQLQQDADLQQHARAGFFSFFSFLTGTFGIRKRATGKRIDREENQRREKQRDALKELEHVQAQERQRWEDRRRTLLEQQAQARDLFERQLREPSFLQSAFDGGQILRSESTEFSRMAARREAQRERDGPGLER